MLSKYKILLQTSAVVFRPVITHRSQLNQTQHARFFASNQGRGDGKGNKPPCKKPMAAKTINVCTPQPKPKDCAPHPKPEKPMGLQDCNVAGGDVKLKSFPGTKPIPAAPVCPKPNLMQDCPQPEGPWNDGPEQSSYTRRLLLGIAVAAATLYCLYALGLFDRKDDSPKKAKKEKKSMRPKIIVKNPASSSDIPNDVPYLLIGGGTASFSAFRSIKSLDPSAKVLVISAEGDYPYMRPPLSKEVWYNDDEEANKNLRFKQWNGTERSLFYEPNDFYAECKNLKGNSNGGVAVARGWTVSKIDVNERKVTLEDGYEIKYKNCLLATGSTPNNLPVFKDAGEDIQEKISLFREIFDFQELNEIIKGGAKSIAIVGGGFLGSELACALARKGKKTEMKVTQVFREPGNMGKVLPEYLSNWTTNKVRDEGVEVITKATVDKVDLDGGMVSLKLSNGSKVKADHVIVAVGASPNTELAKSSQLELDPDYGGYLVNAELMARSSLWIAGDCAGFYDTKLGRRRVEHHDHAVVSGRLAGENMTGAGKPYTHQSMFWSDLGPSVGYEAIGVVDARLPTVGVFAKATDADTPLAVVTATDESNRAKTEANAEPVTPSTKPPSSPSKDGEEYGKGVIFYLRNDVVVGILLWNVFNRMSVARQVLQDERKYDDLNEVAKLFNIHEE